MIDVPFDQYQRYKTTEIVITYLKKYYKLDSLKIIEVGANEHKNLEKFLNKDEIYYLDIQIPEHLKDDQRYILGDATNLVNIKDDEYDMVVALDVYEHIPKGKREDFLSELDRISKYGVMICAPFNFKHVAEAEIRVNEYFRALTGHDYIWLKEHIDEELPCLESTHKIIEKMNKSRISFSHGDIYLWEKILKCHLYSYRLCETTEYIKMIDRLYNSEIFKLDLSDKNYRNFILFSENKMCLEFVENKIDEIFNNEQDIKKIELLDMLIKEVSSINNAIQIEQINKKIKNEECLNELTYYIKENKDKYYSEGKTIKRKIESERIIDKIDLSKYDIGAEIRIDPVNSNCIIDILDLYTVKDNKRIDLNIIRTNCDIKNNNRYIFGTSDPQIYVDLKSTYADNLYFSYVLIQYNNKSINDMIEMLYKMALDKEDEIKELIKKMNSRDKIIEGLKKEVNDRALSVDELSSKNKVLENYIYNIENSNSWKIMMKVKNIFRR